MTQATAPGKVILFGEHAVVYGQPAIAVPVTQVRATADVVDGAGGVHLVAPDVDEEIWLAQAGHDHPLAAAVRVFQRAAELERLPDLTITITSDIPIASGLGSGAATTAALIRALAHHLDRPDLARGERLSALTYEVEKIHHGTPSGIDNTVVALERPVYFVRQQPQDLIETFQAARTLRLVIGDTGRRSSTREIVGHVRRQWQIRPRHFNEIFAACGRITRRARRAIQAGETQTMGQLMWENHRYLQEMTVSSVELDRLVEAARAAGALGAKLSGAGRGGNVVALVQEATEAAVGQALLEAGAQRILNTTVEG